MALLSRRKWTTNSNIYTGGGKYSAEGTNSKNNNISEIHNNSSSSSSSSMNLVCSSSYPEEVIYQRSSIDYFDEEEVVMMENDDEQLMCNEVYEKYFSNSANEENRNFHIADFIKQFTSCSIANNGSKDISTNSLVGGGCKLSKSIFVSKMNDFCISNKIRGKGKTNLYKFLAETFDEAEFPPLNKEELCIDDDDNVRKHILELHCCEYGCTVFDNDELIACPKCKADRCGPCKFCKETIENEACSHGLKYRTPKRIIQYRPILSIIKVMVKHSRLPEVLNYVDLDAAENKYHDLNSGQNYIKNMENMKRLYNDYVDKNYVQIEGQQPSNKKPIMLNLMISFGYDGCRYFQKKTTKVWPMIICFENFPPPLRKIEGIGLHTIGLFSLPTSADEKKFGIEEFLLKKCFVDELLVLNEGIIVNTVNFGPIFVQVRLISHNYDTPALNHMLELEGHTSYYGCSLCGQGDGNFKTVANSTIFIGYRKYLDVNHVLRYRGQSKNISPRGFQSRKYNHSTIKDSEKPKWITQRSGALNISTKKEIEALHVNDSTNEIGLSDEEIELININYDKIDYDINGDPTEKGLTKIKNKLLTMLDKGTGIWHHQDICDYKDFGEVLYYPHCDYRKQLKHKRITMNEYLKKCIAFAKENKGKNNTKAVDGIKGITVFAKLPYFDIEFQTVWDFFHVAEDNAASFLNILGGGRANGPNTKLFCNYYGLHQDCFVSDNSKKKESKPLWMLESKEIERVELWFEAMLVPKGYVNDYKIVKIFSNSGVLSGVQKMKLITSYMEVIMTAILAEPNCNYSTAYISYARIYSDVHTRLLETEYTEQEINFLQQRVEEFLSLHEGAIPNTEAGFMYHELMELPKHIKTVGPMRNNWTLKIERALGKFKERGVKKGTKFYKTTFEYSVEYQNNMANKFFTTLEKSGLIAISEFSPHLLKYEKEIKIQNKVVNNCIVYGDKFSAPSAKLCKGKINLNHLSEYQACQLLDAIVDCICLRCESLQIRYTNSLIFRIRTYYNYEMKNRKSQIGIAQFCNFYQYLKQLTLYQNEDIVTQKGFYIVSNLNNKTKLREGFFLLEDVSNVVKFLREVSFEKYNRALVLGTELRSRGQLFEEINPPTICENANTGTKIEPCNNLNKNYNFRKRWIYKSDYSSWCKYRTSSNIDPYNNAAIFNDIYKQEVDLYGQINQFYYCNCQIECEQLIDKELFLSISGRTTIFPELVKDELYKEPRISWLGKINLMNDASYHHKTFYSARSVYSTAVSIIGTNDAMVPFVRKKRTNGINIENVTNLYMVDLDKARLKLRMNS
jgi:hypothetical protein